MFATNIVDHDIFVVGLMTINGVYLHHVIGQRFSVYQCKGGYTLELDNLNHLFRLG